MENWALKTNPISNVGAWKEGGYGESISLEELYQLYLDYIPRYYEDGMPLSLQLGGFFSASPGEPGEYDIPLMKNCSDPDKTCVCGHARMVMYISAEVLRHNPKCQRCEHAMQCLAGCRASALESTPDDILGIDRAACALFKGGWADKIRETMRQIVPESRCRGLEA